MTEDYSQHPLVKWRQVPELREPVVLAGFFGWSNAGNVSSDTIEYLVKVLEPRVFASISDEPFANYTLDRPVARIEDGIIYDMEPMVTDVGCRSNPEWDHDIIVFLGREPHVGWPAYCDVLLNVWHRLGVKKVCTLGGVQDTVSHSEPSVVSVVASSPTLVAEMCRLDSGIRAADYCGPVSIHTYLLEACRQSGIEAVGLWAHAPAYLHKNPRLVAKMVSIVNRITGMELPVDILKQKSIELDRKINEAIARDPNLKRFVESVEQKDDPDVSASVDEKVIRLDDFLRRESHKDPERSS
jgi:proteasome assembly chaperone (PAC2) family protein